jgi:predicted metalloprotease
MIAGGGIGAVVLAIVVMLMGGDPSEVLQTGPAPGQEAPRAGEPDPGGDFVKGVLYETEQTWTNIFRDQLGREYRQPTLVLFSGATQSACGVGQAAMGPFYCPLDGQVYIDLSFYRELKERFGAPGDAAQAYVIAHEVGHHVQNLLGISERVMGARQSARREEEANDLSVRQELQADCFAGVWARQAHTERQILEPGDVEEAMGAAAAVGDDRIQKSTRGYVVPESFTHGSSAQRVQWFRRGFDSGQVSSCDTFGG